MARFRHAGAGLNFDWQDGGRWSSGSEAKLENGDWIRVKPHRGRWEYHLFGPPTSHDDPEVAGKTGVMFFSGYGDKPAMAAEILGQRVGVDGLDSHEEAQREAERHYMGIAHTRRGRKPPAGDPSRYDGINAPRPLDDDFGDIFGDQS